MANPTEKSEALDLLAANLKRVRLEREFTQEQLAELAGVHGTYVSIVERGMKNISVRSAERLANALGVPVAELFTPTKVQANWEQINSLGT